MNDYDAWVEFRRGEQVTTRKPACYDCGKVCSGDTTVSTHSPDGRVIEVSVCDIDPDDDTPC